MAKDIKIRCMEDVWLLKLYHHRVAIYMNSRSFGFLEGSRFQKLQWLTAFLSLVNTNDVGIRLSLSSYCYSAFTRIQQFFTWEAASLAKDIKIRCMEDL